MKGDVEAVFTVVGKNEEVTKKLAELDGKEVEVKGAVEEKDGKKVLTAEAVKEAGEKKPKKEAKEGGAH